MPLAKQWHRNQKQTRNINNAREFHCFVGAVFVYEKAEQWTKNHKKRTHSKLPTEFAVARISAESKAPFGGVIANWGFLRMVK